MHSTSEPPLGPAFVFPVRVYWEDTDAGGIVYYANYLKFMERARTEWLRSLGLEQARLQREHAGLFVVSEVQLRYLQAARLDDALLVGVTATQIGHSRLALSQTVQRREPDDHCTHLCVGTVRVAWVRSADLRPQRMPAAITRVLAAGLPP